MSRLAGKWGLKVAAVSVLLLCFLVPSVLVRAAEEQGSVGLTATIPSPPPTQAASITVPVNGQTFDNVPIRVSGTCPDGLLVKLFKNNVFGGSQTCNSGSFSMEIDLFSGQNDLVARVYDALDQAGPDSNTVTVTFNDTRGGSGSRVTITTNYAKRGANPGETLTWPIAISGGSGPYAISVDWGDGKPADLRSQTFPGEVILTHIYDSPGVYNVVIRVSDADDVTAFLQVVGVANGPLDQANQADGSGENIVVRNKVLLAPALMSVPVAIFSFWLGKRHELRRIKNAVSKNERPF